MRAHSPDDTQPDAIDEERTRRDTNKPSTPFDLSAVGGTRSEDGHTEDTAMTPQRLGVTLLLSGTLLRM